MENLKLFNVHAALILMEASVSLPYTFQMMKTRYREFRDAPQEQAADPARTTSEPRHLGSTLPNLHHDAIISPLWRFVYFFNCYWFYMNKGRFLMNMSRNPDAWAQAGRLGHLCSARSCVHPPTTSHQGTYQALPSNNSSVVQVV